MKNIIILLLIVVLSITGIYFSINYIDEKYQSAIAVAIATAGIQLILFFLKPLIDKDISRNTKTFGVIYEKKFLLFNELFSEIIEVRNNLEKYYGSVVKNNTIEESVENYNLKIVKNKLFINDNIYKLLRENATKYQFILARLKSSDVFWESENGDFTIEDAKDYILNDKVFKIDLDKIEKAMKKELSIN